MNRVNSRVGLDSRVHEPSSSPGLVSRVQPVDSIHEFESWPRTRARLVWHTNPDAVELARVKTDLTELITDGVINCKQVLDIAEQVWKEQQMAKHDKKDWLCATMVCIPLLFLSWSPFWPHLFFSSTFFFSPLRFFQSDYAEGCFYYCSSPILSWLLWYLLIASCVSQLKFIT